MAKAKTANKSVAKNTAKKPAKKPATKTPLKVASKSAAAPKTAKPAAKAVVKPVLKPVVNQVAKAGGKVPTPIKKSHLPAAPSSKMTLMKLGFSSKEQAAIVAAPHGFKVPDSVDEPATLDAQYDFILIFVENLTEAEVICASLCPSIRNKGRAWVAWPKGGASDIQLDQLSGMVEAEGLVTVTHLSLDEKWSAAKFMHPKADR